MFHTPLTRLALILAGVLCAAGLACPASVASAASLTAASPLKTVVYRGYRFEVPRSWPVIRLGRRPLTCVRFDLHAVYLGRPGANQRCPSWLLGATEAMVIGPGPAATRRESTENPVSDQITAAAPGISITATFDNHAATIDRILASAGLARPAIVLPSPVQLPAGSQPVGGSGSGAAGPASGDATAASQLATSATPATAESYAGSAVGYPMLPAAVENFHGLGFDVCAAPSASYMRTWRADSGYRAVGIYIGGADRACDQQNLTPAWVRQQAAAGWHLIPMYAGPQAAFSQLTSPASQGSSAAEDAVAQAEHFGLGPRTPIYYDMEAYQPAQSAAALTFLTAWTTELHRLGYKSGVYSSSGSAIADLARHYRTPGYVMPDAIYDALWNGARNVSDGAYSAGEWTGGRRLHQFSGDVVQTFGGDTMEIDQDYLEVALATPGGTMQASPGVTSSAGAVTMFYQGSDHHLWEQVATSAGQWRRIDLGGYLTAQPSVIDVNAATTDVFYRGRGDELWELTHTGAGWQPARALPQMRQVGWPRAVAQPNGVIDVFWQGTHDNHLWHAQFNPSRGWSGPQNLGGSLASGPDPAETRSGQVQVFWKGTNGNLWRVVRSLGQSWTAPKDLGMRTLGGPPSAVALPSGEIDVFWEGSTAPHAIWFAVLRPGRAVVGPQKLGGTITGLPWPAVTGGTERVVFRGSGSRLYSVSRRPTGAWGTPEPVTGAGNLRSAPFAGANLGGSSLQVFWVGRRRQVWTIRLTQPGGWRRPADLGGSM